VGLFIQNVAFETIGPTIGGVSTDASIQKEEISAWKTIGQVCLNGIAVLVLFSDAVTKENDPVLGLEEEILGGFRGLKEKREA
ncbi:MAG: hypothetical protein ACO3E9_14100, partial [Gemmataceae bacterium]